MQNVDKATEPNMEDILASIRQIVADDPAPAAPAAKQANVKPAPEPDGFDALADLIEAAPANEARNPVAATGLVVPTSGKFESGRLETGKVEPNAAKPMSITDDDFDDLLEPRVATSRLTSAPPPLTATIGLAAPVVPPPVLNPTVATKLEAAPLDARLQQAAKLPTYGKSAVVPNALIPVGRAFQGMPQSAATRPIWQYARSEAAAEPLATKAAQPVAADGIPDKKPDATGTPLATGVHGAANALPTVTVEPVGAVADIVDATTNKPTTELVPETVPKTVPELVPELELATAAVTMPDAAQAVANETAVTAKTVDQPAAADRVQPPDVITPPLDVATSVAATEIGDADNEIPAPVAPRIALPFASAGELETVPLPLPPQPRNFRAAVLPPLAAAAATAHVNQTTADPAVTEVAATDVAATDVAAAIAALMPELAPAPTSSNVGMVKALTSNDPAPLTVPVAPMIEAAASADIVAALVVAPPIDAALPEVTSPETTVAETTVAETTVVGAEVAGAIAANPASEAATAEPAVDHTTAPIVSTPAPPVAATLPPIDAPVVLAAPAAFAALRSLALTPVTSTADKPPVQPDATAAAPSWALARTAALRPRSPAVESDPLAASLAAMEAAMPGAKKRPPKIDTLQSGSKSEPQSASQSAVRPPSPELVVPAGPATATPMVIDALAIDVAPAVAPSSNDLAVPKPDTGHSAATVGLTIPVTALRPVANDTPSAASTATITAVTQQATGQATDQTQPSVDQTATTAPDVLARADAAPMAEPLAETASVPAAAAIAAPSNQLTVPVSSPAATLSPPAQRTLEDTVVELLRPMLRTWIDTNMPVMVEKALRAETAAMAPPLKPTDTPTQKPN
jgi:cell pole-organizing protein PopZ